MVGNGLDRLIGKVVGVVSELGILDVSRVLALDEIDDLDQSLAIPLALIECPLGSSPRRRSIGDERRYEAADEDDADEKDQNSRERRTHRYVAMSMTARTTT